MIDLASLRTRASKLTLTLLTWTKWWLLPVLANGGWDLIRR
jgi:hypothetical protein